MNRKKQKSLVGTKLKTSAVLNNIEVLTGIFTTANQLQ